MLTVKLMEGLGDCLVAAAAIEEYGWQKAVKVRYITNPVLAPLFENHHVIEFAEDGPADVNLKWASTLRREDGIDVFPLHCINRFASQLGIYADPTKTLTVWDAKGNQIVNEPLSRDQKRHVCINIYSKDKTRRFVPQRFVDMLCGDCAAAEIDVKFIGECERSDQVTDVNEMIELLKTATGFMGPVSFPYHLACVFDVSCLTFFSFMPAWKFSDFTNTSVMQGYRKCVARCEQWEEQSRKEQDCLGGCKVDYDDYQFRDLLEGAFM